MKCAVHIHAPNREKPIDFCDPTFSTATLRSNFPYSGGTLPGWLALLTHNKNVLSLYSSKADWRVQKCMLGTHISNALIIALQLAAGLKLGSLSCAFDS